MAGEKLELKGLQEPFGTAETKKSDDAWTAYKNLYIHKELFKRGLVVVKPKNTSNARKWCPINSKDRIVIKGRELLFHYSDKGGDNKQPLPEAFSTVSTMQQAAQADDGVNLAAAKSVNQAPNRACVRKASNLLSSLIDFAGSKSENAASAVNAQVTDLVIFNPKRREEVFLPLILQQEGGDTIGFYVYPWLSSHLDSEGAARFSGFDVFVTAGCLFGASLKGRNELARSYLLIKHDIKFYPGEKIEEIEVEPYSPYEDMLFNEFKKQAHFINKFSANNQRRQLVYHLPYYDYILFGVELFVRGRITIDALNEFFLKIFLKKEEHCKKVKKICEKFDIDFSIFSPFENIFGHISLSSIQQSEIASTILGILNLPCVEIEPTLDVDEQKRSEKALVQRCLSALQINQHNPLHQQVWQDFIHAIDAANINNLEDLFKVGNAVVVGIAAKGRGDGKICSMLPLAEKQIQISYADFSKKNQAGKHGKRLGYAQVFNATFLESMLCYSSATSGLPFYFDNHLGNLSKLINNGILDYAYKNIGLFAGSATNQHLPTKNPVNRNCAGFQSDATDNSEQTADQAGNIKQAKVEKEKPVKLQDVLNNPPYVARLS